jgi:hypothetical protein
VIHAYPDQPDALVAMASLFTSIKWTSLALVVMMLVTLGALAATRQLRGRSARR